MAQTKKILVIDDEESSQKLLRDMLVPHDYEIWVASDGEDGIQIAKKQNPDLIILDVRLPGMDGFKVQEILSQDESTKKIPVIFVTVKAGIKETLRAMTHGAVGYIEKPFSVKRLIGKVKAILSKDS